MTRPAGTDRRPLTLPAILVLALLSAVAPLATDMYLPGFPALAEDLATSAAAVQMTLTSFLVGLALGQLIIGPLSDRFGRRRPLLLGTGLAIVSGLACALVPNVGALVALRFLQGLGGAAGVVLARAIVSDRTEDATASARLFQVMMMIGGLAPVLAPIVGTGIVALAGWRAIFAVIALLSALSFLGALRQLDESLPPEARGEGGLGTLARGIGAVLVEDTAALAPWVEAAFAGSGSAPLAPIGAPFQIKVWEALLEIPSGHVTTYSALAERIGHPKAVRAVGTAVGRNPISLLIPCHRALRKSGGLGGYHWGLPVKRAMLAREAARREAAE